MSILDSDPWAIDWALSLPLLLLNALIHVFGLTLTKDAVLILSKNTQSHRRFLKFAVIMSIATLLMIRLHALAARMWALIYPFLDPFPNSRLVMLFSFGAMAGFGFGDLSLPPKWPMIGVLQSLAGLLLFGLTTALMFSMMQSVWPAELFPIKILETR